MYFNTVFDKTKEGLVDQVISLIFALKNGSSLDNKGDTDIEYKVQGFFTEFYELGESSASAWKELTNSDIGEKVLSGFYPDQWKIGTQYLDEAIKFMQSKGYTVKSVFKEESEKPDLEYRKFGMFTSFYPNTEQGKKAWMELSQMTNDLLKEMFGDDQEANYSNGKVFTKALPKVLKSLEDAGYTVAKLKDDPNLDLTDDQLLNELGLNQDQEQEGKDIQVYGDSLNQKHQEYLNRIKKPSISTLKAIVNELGSTDDKEKISSSSKAELAKLVEGLVYNIAYEASLAVAKNFVSSYKNPLVDLTIAPKGSYDVAQVRVEHKNGDAIGFTLRAYGYAGFNAEFTSRTIGDSFYGLRMKGFKEPNEQEIISKLTETIDSALVGSVSPEIKVDDSNQDWLAEYEANPSLLVDSRDLLKAFKDQVANSPMAGDEGFKARVKAVNDQVAKIMIEKVQKRMAS